jgi:hypothetical protein
MKKDPTKQKLPAIKNSDGKKESARNIKDMEGKLKDLEKHIEWLKGVHEHYSKRHKEAIKRHKNGDYDWILRNHYHDGPIGK